MFVPTLKTDLLIPFPNLWSTTNLIPYFYSPAGGTPILFLHTVRSSREWSSTCLRYYDILCQMSPVSLSKTHRNLTWRSTPVVNYLSLSPESNISWKLCTILHKRSKMVTFIDLPSSILDEPLGNIIPSLFHKTVNDGDRCVFPNNRERHWVYDLCDRTLVFSGETGETNYILDIFEKSRHPCKGTWDSSNCVDKYLWQLGIHRPPSMSH